MTERWSQGSRLDLSRVWHLVLRNPIWIAKNGSGLDY